MHQQSQTNFSIDPNVMVIRPISGSEGTYTRTELLYSNGKRKTKNVRPLRYIEMACRYRYNTYTHIKGEVKTLTGITSKPPFFLPDSSPITFFSSHSDRIQENCWINVDYIRRIEHYKTGKSKVHLHGGQSLIVNVSKYTLLHQYQNGIYLAYKLLRQEIKAGELVKKYNETQHEELINIVRDFVHTLRDIRLTLNSEQHYYHPKIAEDPPFKNY
ncbi:MULTISPECIES: competence protein ComK [unclassified Staphylococcus]|uniref:competence protein ComK n=1 Tax=unclassified Staphylococcus TaxID=91994 RepID=UPI0021D11141|nr:MULTISPECIES: competence protein ComK [unclassified Staphylococcus]UXR74513.1 competence protein ComK [Staphylococcus sp. IVB6238]UXR76897.1 competence protein ComK [Staphylococcus sp. IVB6233]UXR81023.1 competence protein ComK [Staphylococcus sp. IVB6218]